MRDLLNLLGPCLILPVVFFVALIYPGISNDADTRGPLLPVYYLSRQLRAEMASAEAAQYSLPPIYVSILAEYGGIPQHPHVASLADLSRSAKKYTLPQRMVGRFVLWWKTLPFGLLLADPVADIVENLETIRKKEKELSAERERIVRASVLDDLRYHLPPFEADASSKKGWPPGLLKEGLVFAGEHVSLDRPDVRRRIEHQIEYLVNDFRTTTSVWLRRRDRYGALVGEILRREGVPSEFALIPALESGYTRSATSPLLATGWWQFVKPTAVNAVAGNPTLDWTLRVDRWRDERCDLAMSSRAAARYLKWIRSAIRGGSKKASWLTVAAAYNGGITQIGNRVAAYNSDSYWNIKLPLETEDYVPRWIAFAVVDSNRQFYGFDLPGVPALEFDTLEDIRLTRDLPLNLLAVLTESSVRFIREINGAVPDAHAAIRAPQGRNEGGVAVHVPRGWKLPVIEALRATYYVEGGKPHPVETSEDNKVEQRPDLGGQAAPHLAAPLSEAR